MIRKFIQSHFLKSFFLLLFFQNLYSLHSQAQDIDSLMGIQAKADPREKLYFQFDKSYYGPGEIVWFKTYVFRGSYLSTTSKNLYVELINETGKIYKKISAPIINSQAEGSIPIGFDFSNNYLFIRAFTISMLNGDTSLLYTKTIPILLPNANKADALPNNPDSPVKEIKPGTESGMSESEIVMKIYPEGGDLVENILSIVGFRITNKQGFPFSTKGDIVNDKGEVITNFAVKHDGMGAFVLTPSPKEKYFAVWKDAKGLTQKTKIPEARSNGVVLRILPAPNGKRFTIIRSEGAPDSYKTLYLVGSMNQRVVYQARANLTTEMGTIGIIPTKGLPSGILQITVLDAQYRPLAERVCFVNNQDFEFPAEISIPQVSHAKRALNEGIINVPGNAASVFSISVTDADLNLTSPVEDNIISHVLLTGDLRGKIWNPYFYFRNKSDSAAQFLDYVMLTHGWRRYTWELLMRGRALEGAEKENNYLSLNGKIAGLHNPKDYEGQKLNFIVKTKDSTQEFISATLNKNGELSYDGLIFYGFAKIYFQPYMARLSFDKSQLYINNGLYLSPNQTKINPENLGFVPISDPVLYQKLTNNMAQRTGIEYKRSNSQINLKEVVVKEKAKTNLDKLEKQFGTGIFSGGDSRNFDVANDPFAGGATNIFQYLQSRVPGLQISNTSGGGTPSLNWRGSVPTLFLDGQKTDAEFLSNINISNIAYVKVYDPGSSGIISTTGGGAIAIFTKRGGDNKVEFPGMTSLNLAGYTLYKEFASPDYASGLVDNLPDLRSTLYWNPRLAVQNSKHTVHFSFYNSDLARHFRIIVEGVNTENRLVHIEKVF